MAMARRMLPRLRHVIGKLHTKQVVHVRTERFLDAQSHFRRQGRLAVQKIGQGGTTHLQDLRCFGNAQAERVDDLGLDQVAGMGWVLHRHCAATPNGSRSKSISLAVFCLFVVAENLTASFR